MKSSLASGSTLSAPHRSEMRSGQSIQQADTIQNSKKEDKETEKKG